MNRKTHKEFMAEVEEELSLPSQTKKLFAESEETEVKE
jgi:hypothetical protein